MTLVKTREEIESAANLLGDVINMFVQSSYIEYMNSNIIRELESGISKIVNDVANVTSETKNLKSFASKQKILALNASKLATTSSTGGLILALIRADCIHALKAGITSIVTGPL